LVWNEQSTGGLEVWLTTLIIAEAGVNHDGKLSQALDLVNVAFESGADIVKFQTFRATSLATKEAPSAAYQRLDTRDSSTQYQMLEKLQFSEKHHSKIIDFCNSKNIQFLSTAFDEKSAEMLYKLGQRKFKIPSGEITNYPLLAHIGSYGLPVFLSTGMSNLDEIEAAIQHLENSGTKRDQITVLQCTTAYPAPMHDLNLLAIQAFANRFGVKVGYSDHSRGIEASIAAVALGASVIEKHFTLDKNLPGPDHKASLEPDELKSLVQAIRNVELALGDGHKRLMNSEVENISVARKSIVASKSIKSGEKFSTDNLTTKRPGTGISPMEWQNWIGKTANRDYLPDEFITND
jgi:N,N'-diacetyllegionaminate synthase